MVVNIIHKPRNNSFGTEITAGVLNLQKGVFNVVCQIAMTALCLVIKEEESV